MKKLALIILFLFLTGTTFSQGNSVGTADQFCSGGSGLVFPNVTGAPNGTDVGCLYSIPNPAYYFLQIEQPGDLFFNISQETAGGVGLDVDFITWGPFPSLAAANAAITLTACTPTACPNNTTNPTFYPYATDNITDCSFSAEPTEDLTIIGGLSGQIYVVLITNYSDQAGFITLQQTGGTGTTSCTDIPVCGGNFYDSGGDTGSYSNNETTTTTIYPNTIGGTVTVDFTAFNVLAGDVLTVYNGPNATFPILGTVVNATASYSSTDATGTLTFLFTSNASGVSTGWEADVTCTTPPPPPTCGSNFYDIGGSTRNYLNNETTTTTIYPIVAGGTVTVDFTVFNVLAGDVLTVYDGPNATYPSLGNVTTTPSSFSSTNTSGELTFVFTSNSAGTSTGWEADVSCTIPPTCSSYFFDSGGATGNYSNNELTTTTFFPDSAGDAVTVTFTLFDLEYADVLLVYDGPDTTSSLIGTFNGTAIPGPFSSSHATGALTFVFDSDSSVVYEGWEAHLSCAPYVPPIVCGAPFYDNGGASGNYSSGQNQTTTLVPDIPGTAITATFTAFNTEATYDVLRIYDGPDATSPLLGAFSGTTLPPTFTSSHATGALTFVFTSDGSVNRAGWVADITCTKIAPTCGETFYDSGGIAGNYSNNENETTVITPINPGDAVTTTFTAFNLDSGDTLEVFDGTTSLGTFSGTTIPGPFTSSDPSGELTFIFTSNGSGIQSGWAADVTCSILCNISIAETLNPLGADDCTLNYSQLVATSTGSPGGTTTIYLENFNGANFPAGWIINNGAYSAEWIISNSNNAGGTPREAMLDWTTGGDIANWILRSPAINITGYTNLQLSFNQDLWQFGTDFTIFLETSINGTTWNPRYTYANPPDFNEIRNVDLSALDGNNTLYFRFRFSGDSFDLFRWSIDNISLKADDIPLPPQITWSPSTGLFTDAALTTPYTGGFTDTVYASPNGTETYTATDQNNCSETVTVARNRKVWNGSESTNWYRPNNWTPIGIPTSSDCVVIPATTATNGRSPLVDIINAPPLPPNPAEAKSVSVRNNGSLEVNANTFLEIVDELNVQTSGEVLIKSTGSLIQVTDVTTNNNTGNIRMQREVLGVGTQNYVYWSSPVEGSNVGNINMAASEPRWQWEPTTANIYGNWTAASGTMTVGRGYIVRGLATPPSPIPPNNAEFLGRPSNGVINVPITRGTYTGIPYAGASPNTQATNIDDNWNLVGNPYPSAISANAFLVENASGTTPKIDGTIYLWSHVSLPSGNTTQDPFYGNYVYNYLGSDYVAYNIVGPNPPVFLGNIGAGQSFFVQMLDGAGLSNTVAFNNSMRSGSPANDNFMRTEERHRIWLDLVNSNEVASSTLVGYVTDATNERDLLYDGYDLSDTSMQFYSLIGEEEMTIQGRALPFDQEDRVSLGMVVPQNSNYKIAINTLDGLFGDASQNIYLEDTYLNTIYDLRLNPYEFTSESGTFNDRFILRYTNETLSTPDQVANFGFNIIGLKNYIKVTSGNSPIKTVKVYDVLGRLLADYKDVNALEFKFELINQSEGALIVKATLYNGQQKIKKVIY